MAWRELMAWFAQPAAWVFLAAFVGVAAYLGLRDFFERGVADLRDFFRGLRWAMALLAPAATMRLLAEERRLGTFELLFALPLAPWEAVLGKFLAALALVATGLILTLALPLLLLPLGPFDPGQLAAGYLGALLLGAAYVSAGLLASALTRSQAVAFVLGAAGCLALALLGDPQLLDQLQRLLPPPALRALASLGASGHQEAFARGLLDLRDALYFLVLVPALLFWTALALERREPDRREPWLAAGLSLLALLLAQAILAEPALRLRVDLTRDGRNSLAPALSTLLRRLPEPLTVRAYLSGRPPERVRPHLRALEDLVLDVAAELGHRCDVQLVDPDADGLDTLEQEQLAAQARRDGVEKYTLTVPGEGGRVEQAPVYVGLALLMGSRPPAAIPFAPASADLEADLATALQRLAFPRARVALSGLATERYQQLRTGLRQAHSFQDLDLAQSAAISTEVVLLVHAAPLPPSAEETAKLQAFVAAGGRLVLLAESHWIDQRRRLAQPFPATPFSRALEGWGLRLGPGLVCAPPGPSFRVDLEQGNAVEGPYPWYVATSLQDDPGSPLGLGQGATVLFYAGEVGPAATLPAGARWTPLLSSPPGFAPAEPADVHPLHPLPAAGAPAPRVLAGAVVPGEGRGGRVVLLGDTDLCRDGNATAPGGVALVLALVDWALERAAIRGRGRAPTLARDQALGMPAARYQDLVLGLLYFLLPGGVLAAGLALVQLRLRRAGQQAAALRDARAAALGPGGAP